MMPHPPHYTSPGCRWRRRSSLADNNSWAMLKRSGLGLLLVLALGYGQAPRPNLRERAAAGDPEAQFNLAKNYETGRAGYKKDFAEAERWYRQAAEQGDPFAQASLAILYRFGKGVPQDYVQAFMWFHLAASQTTGGDQESIAELRDATAARMTLEQVEEAKRRAGEWKPKLTK
jgi:uncharacterized protein